MSKVRTHMVRVRPSAFGGILTTSLCGRLRTLSDGMNLTHNRDDVTCAFCLKRLAHPLQPIVPRDRGTEGEK